MSWFRVDDGFWCHRKVERLEEEFGAHTHAQAMALWVLAGSFASRYEGAELTLAKLRKLVPWSPVRAIKALVSVGLWEETEVGYRFHDAADYRPQKRSPKPPPPPPTSPEPQKNLRRTSEHSENNLTTTSLQPQNNLGARPSESLRKRNTPEPEPEPEPVTPPSSSLSGREATSRRGVVHLDNERLPLMATKAYRDAIEADGGIYDGHAGDRSVMARIGHLAATYAERRGEPVVEVLQGWAKRYVSERQKRAPRWWLERVQVWVAEGGAAPIPGSQASAEAAYEAEWDRMEARIVLLESTGRSAEARKIRDARELMRQRFYGSKGAS